MLPMYPHLNEYSQGGSPVEGLPVCHNELISCGEQLGNRGIYINTLVCVHVYGDIWVANVPYYYLLSEAQTNTNSVVLVNQLNCYSYTCNNLNNATPASCDARTRLTKTWQLLAQTAGILEVRHFSIHVHVSIIHVWIHKHWL